MAEIRVKVKNVFGKDLFYPLDYAQPLEALTGQKTLTPKSVEALKELGFTFQVEAISL